MDSIDSDEELLHLLEGDPVMSPPAPLRSPDAVAPPSRQRTPTTPLPEMLRCMNISSALAQRSSTPLSLGSSPSVSRSSRTFRPSHLTQYTASKVGNSNNDIELSDDDAQNMSIFSQNSRSFSRDGTFSDQHNPRKHVPELSPVSSAIPRNTSSYPQDKSHPSYLSRSRSRSSLSALPTRTDAVPRSHPDTDVYPHDITQLCTHTTPQPPQHQRHTSQLPLSPASSSASPSPSRSMTTDTIPSHDLAVSLNPRNNTTDSAAVHITTASVVVQKQLQTLKHSRDSKEGRASMDGSGNTSGVGIGEAKTEVVVKMMECSANNRRERSRRRMIAGEDVVEIECPPDGKKDVVEMGVGSQGDIIRGEKCKVECMRDMTIDKVLRTCDSDNGDNGDNGGDVSHGMGREEDVDDEESVVSDFSQTSRHSQYSRISRKSQVSEKSVNSGSLSFPRSDNSGKMGFSGYSGHISRLPVPRRQVLPPATVNAHTDTTTHASTGANTNTRADTNVSVDTNTNTDTNAKMNSYTKMNASIHSNAAAQTNIHTSPPTQTHTPVSTHAVGSVGSTAGVGARGVVGNGVPVRALTMETLLLFDAMNGRREEEKRSKETEASQRADAEKSDREKKEKERLDRERARYEREQREKEREKEEEKLLSHSENITQTYFSRDIGLSGIDLSEIAGIRNICGVAIPVGPETARLCAQEERALQLLQVTEARLTQIQKKMQQRGQKDGFVDEMREVTHQEKRNGIDVENSGYDRKNRGHSGKAGEDDSISRKIDISDKNRKLRNVSTPSRIPLPPRNNFSPIFPIPNTTSPVSILNTNNGTSSNATAAARNMATNSTPAPDTAPNITDTNNNTGIISTTVTSSTATTSNMNIKMTTAIAGSIGAAATTPSIEQTSMGIGNCTHSGENVYSRNLEGQTSSGYAFAHAFGKGHGTENGFDHRAPEGKLRNHKARGYGDKYRSKSRKKREPTENIQFSREPRNSRSHSRPVSTVLPTSTRHPSPVSSSESSIPESRVSTQYPESCVRNVPLGSLEERQRPKSTGTNVSGISLGNKFPGGGIGISNDGKGPRPHSAVVGKNAHPGRGFSGMQIPGNFPRPVSAIPTTMPNAGISTDMSPSANTGTGTSMGVGISKSACISASTNNPSSASVVMQSTPVPLHGGSYAAHHHIASQRSYAASSRGDGGTERAQARVKAKKRVVDSRNGVAIVKMDVHEIQRSVGGYTPIE